MINNYIIKEYVYSVESITYLMAVLRCFHLLPFHLYHYIKLALLKFIISLENLLLIYSPRSESKVRLQNTESIYTPKKVLRYLSLYIYN